MPRAEELSLHWSSVEDRASLRAQLAAVTDSEEPLLIHFRAAWAIPTKELEATTFKDSKVRDKLRAFTLISIDVTEDLDGTSELQELLKAQTLPKVMVFCSAPEVKLYLDNPGTVPMPKPVVDLDHFLGAAPFAELLKKTTSCPR